MYDCGLRQPVFPTSRYKSKAFKREAVHLVHVATLKKKLVSCPADGQNCGQSGSRKNFFFSQFSFFGKKTVKIILKKKRRKNGKKSSQSALTYSPGCWTGNNIFLKVCLWVAGPKCTLGGSKRVHYLTGFCAKPKKIQVVVFWDQTFVLTS